MNYKFYHIILTIQALFFSTILNAQSVGIGTTTPNPSAKVEMVSSTQGFLPPRMTFTQRNAILQPAAGLVIWCTDCDELQVFDGKQWKNFSGTVASQSSLPSVRICNNFWTLKNLNVTTFSNGDPIPVIIDSATWVNTTSPAMCWYNNSSANGNTFGALYNWYAVNDPRGLAPTGWHIPNLQEWAGLTNCLGGFPISGGKLKDSAALWTLTPNIGATNSSGFSGVPGGYRDGRNNTFLANSTNAASWWTAASYGTDKATLFYVINDGKMTLVSVAAKQTGLSVRCVKN